MTFREFSSFCKHAQASTAPQNNFSSTLALKYQQAVQNVGQKYGITPRQTFGPGPVSFGPGAGTYNSYVSAIRQQESGGKINAINKSSGAMGLYQFMPKTLRGLGYTGSFNDFLKNPALQNQYMDKFTRQNAKSLGFDMNNLNIQQAKYLAAAHYGGVGGARKIMSGNNGYGNTNYGGKSPYGYMSDIYNRMIKTTYKR